MNNTDQISMFMMLVSRLLNASKDNSLIKKQIFNVGSNKLNHKIKDLAKLIGKTKIEIQKTLTDERDYHIDFTKIKEIKI